MSEAERGQDKLAVLLDELMSLDHVLRVILESPDKLGAGFPRRFSDAWACFIIVLYPKDAENPYETAEYYEHGATPLEAVRKVFAKYGPSRDHNIPKDWHARYRAGGWEAVG